MDHEKRSAYLRVEKKYETYLKITVKQTGLTFFVRVIGYLLGFVSQVIYARFLGADLYGIYSIGLTVMTVASLLSVFGMNNAMVRFIGAYHTQKEKTRAIIRFGLLTVFVLSIITAVSLIVFKKIVAVNVFHDPRVEKILPYFAIGVILLSETNVLGGIFQGFKKPSIFFFYKELVDRIIRISIFILLYFLGVKLLGVVIATLSGIALSLAGLLTHLIKERLDVFKKQEGRYLDRREILSYSSNMIFVAFTYFLMGQVNRLLLGVYLDAKSVGIYTLSDNLSTLSIFILTSFNSVFASGIADLYHNKELKMLERMYSNVTRWIVSLTIPITLWMIIFSEDILSIFGKDYTEGKWVLIFLTLGQFINAFVGPNGLMLSMSGHQKFEMINGVIVASLNIFLNILLIPKLGVVGSAIAGGIAISTVNIIKSVEVYFIMGMNPYNRRFLKVLVATIVTWISLLIFKFFTPSILVTIFTLVISFTVMFLTLYALKLYPEVRIIIGAFMKK